MRTLDRSVDGMVCCVGRVDTVGILLVMVEESSSDGDATMPWGFWWYLCCSGDIVGVVVTGNDRAGISVGKFDDWEITRLGEGRLLRGEEGDDGGGVTRSDSDGGFECWGRSVGDGL